MIPSDHTQPNLSVVSRLTVWPLRPVGASLRSGTVDKHPRSLPPHDGCCPATQTGATDSPSRDRAGEGSTITSMIRVAIQGSIRRGMHALRSRVRRLSLPTAAALFTLSACGDADHLAPAGACSSPQNRYPIVTFPQGTVDLRGLQITDEAIAPTLDVPVALDGCRVVKGRLEGGRTPPLGVLVGWTRDSTPPLSSLVRTNGAGEFVFCDVPLDSVRICVVGDLQTPPLGCAECARECRDIGLPIANVSFVTFRVPFRSSNLSDSCEVGIGIGSKAFLSRLPLSGAVLTAAVPPDSEVDIMARLPDRFAPRWLLRRTSNGSSVQDLAVASVAPVLGRVDPRKYQLLTFRRCGFELPVDIQRDGGLRSEPLPCGTQWSFEAFGIDANGRTWSSSGVFLVEETSILQIP